MSLSSVGEKFSLLDELVRLSQRMDTLESTTDTVRKEVLSTVPEELPEASSAVAVEVVRTAPLLRADPTGKAQNEASSTVPPGLPRPLTQSALGKRLGCSDKAIGKHRERSGKEKFAAWRSARDPDGIAWAWEGSGGRGKPQRFVTVE